MDRDMMDSAWTGVMAATLYSGVNMLFKEGVSISNALNTDALVVGAAAAAGEYGSEKIAAMAGISGNDQARMIRTAGCGLAAGGAAYYLSKDPTMLAYGAAAGVAGHIASQYYVYGAFYL